MKHSVIAFTIVVAVATTTATHLPFMLRCIPGDFSCSSDPVGGNGGTIISKDQVNYLDQNLKTTTAMLLSDGEGDEGEDEGKDEKGEGDDNKEDDTGPDRTWGAAKLG